jgi:dipeptidase D
MSIHEPGAGTGVPADLKPSLVWQMFQAISRIPRCSKKERKICSWIKAWAKRRNIPCRSDRAGNLLLRREPSTGWEEVPVLVLQAHLDMVCVKSEGVRFDFDKDPIQIRVDGASVRSEGTTLGADNGIGVAYCLAALTDPQLQCGPLEVLLTVDEEAGGTGALGLKAGFFSGRYLLNLDSEETGIITIGTAGLEITDFGLPMRWKKATGWAALSLIFRGLAGGHSGMDIHLPRLNAIKLTSEALNRLGEQLTVRLGRFEGGEAANSIPAKADCIVLVPEQAKDRALAVLDEWRQQTLNRARKIDPGLEISIQPDNAKKASTIEETGTIRRLLSEIPHGALEFSKTIEGLVESSSNLARVRSKKNSFEITVSYRSSLDSSLDELGAAMKRLGERYGARIKQHSRAPGWTARPDSPFSKLVQEHYGAVLGRPVELKAFHAGLECGIFTGIAPDLQMASIGPDIHSVHTPREHVDIPSVARIWAVLGHIIAAMRELRKTGDEDE